MPAADIILKNANVISMEPGQPVAELVAIKGDKVRLVAGSGELEQVRGAKTRVIDCQGRTVVPGFNDAHCHIFSFIRKLLSLDLSPSSVSSIKGIKAIIRRQVQNTPPGEWITGTDYNEFYLAEKRHPDRRDLDEVAPHHPVVLAHRSLHACVLNSRALSLAGITRATPEPPGGLIDRYLGTGELQDATVVNDYGRWQTLHGLKEAGEIKSRVSMMIGAGALPEFQQHGLTFGSGDSQLRLGAVKIMLNEATGELQPSPRELNRMVLDTHRAGFQVAIHAVERMSVEAAIGALEYIDCQYPRAGRRHRIEHCSQCPPRLLERLRRLGAVVVTQPPFIYYSGERYLATLPVSDLKWLYRIGSFHRSGLTVAGSSDCPVVPADPLVGIYAAVTRRDESGQQLLPREAISAGAALEMYTKNAAHASFEEKTKGSLAPGKLADIIVLSDDPTKTPPERIKDIKVEMTIIGGEVVWAA